MTSQGWPSEWTNATNGERWRDRATLLDVLAGLASATAATTGIPNHGKTAPHGWAFTADVHAHITDHERRWHLARSYANVNATSQQLQKLRARHLAERVRDRVGMPTLWRPTEAGQRAAALIPNLLPLEAEALRALAVTLRLGLDLERFARQHPDALRLEIVSSTAKCPALPADQLPALLKVSPARV